MNQHKRVDLNTRHSKTTFYIRTEVWDMLQEQHKDDLTFLTTDEMLLTLVSDVVIKDRKITKFRHDLHKMVELYLSIREIVV